MIFLIALVEACLMTLAHSFVYGTYYVPAMVNTPQELGTRDIIALIITAPMFTIMIILMVTSFMKVRHRMKPLVWKNVQRLSYPWFALVCPALSILNGSPGSRHDGGPKSGL